MALKGEYIGFDRPDAVDISKINVSAATRGVMAMHYTSGSGVGRGDNAGQVHVPANPSGYKVAGLLLNDQVALDETIYHRNRQKDVMLTDERCTLGRKGTAYTNAISGTPAVGDTAYVTTNCNFTPTLSATGGLVATPKAGVFVTIKDENGYAGIDFNLPIV